MTNFIQELRDGIMLCELINSILPNTIVKIHKTQHILHKLENIILFLKACKMLGVYEIHIFSEWDLLEMRNMEKVYDCILELSSIAFNITQNRHKIPLAIASIKAETINSSGGNTPKGFGSPKSQPLTPKNSIDSKSPRLSNVNLPLVRELRLPKRNRSFTDFKLMLGTDSVDKVIPLTNRIEKDNNWASPNEN